MTDNSYSPSVINNMASDIIAVLQPVCSVMAPTPLTFIRALPQAMQLDDPFNQYMLFVAESCLMYLSVVNKYKPSQVAGVAMVVAQRSLALGPSPVPVSVDEIHAEKTSYKQHRQYKPWDAKEVLLYTRYSVLELKPCIEHVQVLLDTKHPEHEELYQVKAVARKYGRNLRDMSLYPLNFDVPFPTETLTTPLRVEERLSISSMDME